ncbi:MAG: hypothetical protein HYZ53_04065 [Planctomycetes bacterium]|nr:hypothetical protein [Planctomycetota bacterium]
MPGVPDPKSPTPPTKTTWFILFAAFTGTIPLYGVVAFVLRQSERLPVPSDDVHGVFRWTLYAVSFASFLAAAIVPRLFIRAHTPPDPKGPIGADPRPLPHIFLTASILTLAFSESVAIYGLVLVMMGEPLLNLLVLGGASLAFNVAYVLPQGLAYWSNEAR